MLKKLIFISLVFSFLYLLILSPRADRAQTAFVSSTNFFRKMWTAFTTGEVKG